MKSIVDIVEHYTEKCSISTIRVDESSKKLIIEQAENEQNLRISSFSSSSSSILTNFNIKQEPENHYVDEASELLNFSDDVVVVKEEPMEQPSVISSEEFVPSYHLPLIVQHSHQNEDAVYSAPQRRRFNRKSTTDEESKNSVSKAALKMRAYRERLKKPENFHRFLRHQQQQREWNKRHYFKKQIMTGKPIRQRRSRLPTFEYSDDFDDSHFSENVDEHDRYE